MKILLVFAAAQVLTIIIEGIAMYVWSGSKEWVYYSFLCNCMTNPAVNLLAQFAYNYTDLGYYGPLAVLEILALLVEGFVYMHLCGWKWSRAMMVSAMLNILSFGAGLMIF